MSERAVPHVRRFLGQQLRAIRKERGLSQERLGEHASLSGKFIGEVERGEKSISVDSLYRVSVALEVPLGDLTDVKPRRRNAAADRTAERILTFISRRRRSELRTAYEVLRAMFGEAS